MTKFFPFEIIKLRLGIAAGIAILVLVALGITSIPDIVWYPMIQLPTFTLLLFTLSNRFNNVPVFQSIAEHGWLGAFIGAAIFVFFINYMKMMFNSNSESFYGGSSAIGRTPFQDDPFCPPKLNFKDPIDTDTEPQTPACISNPNELTEEQRLDEIDIYIRDAQESIARVTSYLNTASPDERWLSKKEMDDPSNRDLNKK